MPETKEKMAERILELRECQWPIVLALCELALAANEYYVAWQAYIAHCSVTMKDRDSLWAGRKNDLTRGMMRAQTVVRRRAMECRSAGIIRRDDAQAGR